MFLVFGFFMLFFWSFFDIWMVIFLREKWMPNQNVVKKSTQKERKKHSFFWTVSFSRNAEHFIRRIDVGKKRKMKNIKKIEEKIFVGKSVLVLWDIYHFIGMEIIVIHNWKILLRYTSRMCYLNIDLLELKNKYTTQKKPNF